MPKYTFTCECGFTDQLIKKVGTSSITCPDCGEQANRRMPKLAGPPEVREKVSEFGKSHKKDQEKLLNDRQSEYYWTHEVPKFVASGTYTIETMLEMGWVYFDDAGRMHTRTSPPNKG